MISINPDHPQPELIEKAADIIRNGGVVIYPTRGLYGLGTDATRLEAVEQIFRIKHRSPDKPLSILIAYRQQVADWCCDVSIAAEKLMDAFWPGRITIVFRSKRLLPSMLTGGSDKIGIRQPGHAVAMALVRTAACPITGTSANISGFPGCHRISDLPDELLNQADLILDAGPLVGGPGSTVVDVSEENPVVLREGAVSIAEIEKALK